MKNLLKEYEELPVISSALSTGSTTRSGPKSPTESLISGERIRIACWENDSIIDGPGLRFVLFVQGCERNCPGCHNPATHARTGGRWASVEEILEVVDRNPLLDGITISGGEPFLQSTPCAVLSREIHKRGLSVAVYTGFTFEEILCCPDSDHLSLLKETDILIDGPYLKNQRSLDLKFRGSSNQRIIDVPKSLAANKIIEHFW
ncbi:MAG: anaerobic ribonucleoside-triphosphate reductase activating protein [Thermoguttaceae bacterium]|nr:anaerobic ribonucleoside-triphosphate reductase activating protein [Thermoguttaceae bacterium]